MTEEPAGLLLGGAGEGHTSPQFLRLDHANRHGLIAGATGTGKTVTLQILAQGFSNAGVPVFVPDIKGDLAGLAQAGSESHPLHEAFAKRAATIGFPLRYEAAPVALWDIWGEHGHPVRTTVTEIGPLLLSRLLELNETQEGVLHIAFVAADEEGLLLLDLEDLRSLLAWVNENREGLSRRFGHVAAASIGAIQRRLLVLKGQGGDRLFGEPALDLADLMRQSPDGRGVVNVLAAHRLMAAPRLYGTFLLWLLSELFEQLPEVGDPEKPVLVLFFEEAHLLFDEAPKALVDKIEQVVRLIRSKGVGVYFVTQNPDDIPEDVLAQLGNRVQHALRAWTAKDRTALTRAAANYRDNPRFDVADAIRDVGTGEAVTSLLDAKGVPGEAQRTLIRPPASRLGPLTEIERAAIRATSPVGGRYENVIDRESASEILFGRAAQATQADEQDEGRAHRRGRRYGRGQTEAPRPVRRGDTVGEAFVKSLARSLGTRTGTALVRGVMGGLFRRR